MIEELDNKYAQGNFEPEQVDLFGFLDAASEAALLVGTMIFESLDWVVTGYEVGRDVATGNVNTWTYANLAGLILPGAFHRVGRFVGKSDNVVDVARYSDEYLDIIAGDDNLRAAKWADIFKDSRYSHLSSRTPIRLDSANHFDNYVKANFTGSTVEDFEDFMLKHNWAVRFDNADTTVEIGAVYRDGVLVRTAFGEAGSIAINPNNLNLKAGDIFTHLHPPLTALYTLSSISPYSLGDVGVFANKGLHEMRGVSDQARFLIKIDDSQLNSYLIMHGELSSTAKQEFARTLAIAYSDEARTTFTMTGRYNYAHGNIFKTTSSVKMYINTIDQKEAAIRLGLPILDNGAGSEYVLFNFDIMISARQ